MWLAPKVILSNQVDNKIEVILTKPSKMLERTLKQEPVTIIPPNKEVKINNTKPFLVT